MFYFDVMLESEDQVLINKVIENATYQMCIEGGEAVIQDVEDYVDLLMTENYEPTPQFDEYMFESLSPYLEENAKYLGMFLFEGTNKEKRVKREEIKKRKAEAGNLRKDAKNQIKKTSPDEDALERESQRRQGTKSLSGVTDNSGGSRTAPKPFQKDYTSDKPGIDRKAANKEKMGKVTQRLMTGQSKLNKKVGLMQKVKNTFGGAKTEKQKAVGGIGSAMLKGLQNAKRSVGKGLQKVGGNKSGLLGKVASAGKNMVRSSNLAKANTMRANRGEGKKIPTTKKV